MNWPLIIVIAIVVIVILAVILLYNGLVQKRLRVDEALAQIQVQLKRRHDLIPNLVNAVRGYMEFEQKVLTDVTNARASAIAAGAQGPAAQAQAENVLTGALRSLFAVVENYPQLKANENVLSLQEQLTTTENQIGFSRQHYNASVLDYNTSIQTFPAVLIAGILGFVKREFFEAEAEAQTVPTVDLTLGGAAPATGAMPTAAPPVAPPAAPPAPPAAPPAAPPPAADAGASGDPNAGPPAG